MEITEQLSKLTLRDRDLDDELAENIIKLTLQEDYVTKDNLASPAGFHSANTPQVFSDAPPRPNILFKQIASGQYSKLRSIDQDIDSRSKEILRRLDSLASPDHAIDQKVIDFLEEEVAWLQTTLAQVDIYVAVGESVALLKSALRNHLVDITEAVQCYKLILSCRLPDSTSAEATPYNAGKMGLPSSASELIAYIRALLSD